MWMLVPKSADSHGSSRKVQCSAGCAARQHNARMPTKHRATPSSVRVQSCTPQREGRTPPVLDKQLACSRQSGSIGRQGQAYAGGPQTFRNNIPASLLAGPQCTSATPHSASSLLPSARLPGLPVPGDDLGPGRVRQQQPREGDERAGAHGQVLRREQRRAGDPSSGHQEQQQQRLGHVAGGRGGRGRQGGASRWGAVCTSGREQ